MQGIHKRRFLWVYEELLFMRARGFDTISQDLDPGIASTSVNMHFMLKVKSALRDCHALPLCQMRRRNDGAD